MSDSKITFKVGAIEFSGEGEPDWLSKQLDKVIEKVPDLLKVEASNPQVSKSQEHNASMDGSGGSFSGLSVLNIAGKLPSKSGSELVIVACAYLHFVENKTSFSRDDISSTMKKATGIYKDSHLANLTTSLASLEKNGSLLKSGGSYSLSASKVNEINAALSR